MNKGKENKPHIGIYGRRNVGKSSLINNISGQEIAIVADFKGTTTDPVKRSFEITGFGPVILIDTAGIDDEGEVGKLRVQKSLKTLKEIDLAILVISENIFDVEEKNLIDQFKKEGIPFFIIHNKSDLVKLNKDLQKKIQEKFNCPVIDYSVETNGNIEVLLNTIKELLPESSWKITSLLGDLISYGDIVLLITPIDIEAPQGRLILPQIQTIRDILDNDCVAIVLKEREVDSFLKKTGIKPKLAITDSQIFLKAAASIPRDIPLTGFSVLLARYKGDFDNYLIGTPKINDLKDGDKILILESCSHHVSCDDIGRVKIPRWLSNYTGKSLEYIVIAGLDEIPGKITDYALVVQCGGCVLTRKQVISRLKPAVEAGVPVTNYGMLIAFVQGIYDRAIEPFVKSNDADLNYL
ncbi:MAG: [FeFe] hydrogenase H-cluster maturation GTPase HydF [Bacteroidales bacterium]|jgi:[FeFe] hydrogenase H-cluster maturation GTPase HydF